ncbi:MAG TPA: hypothetical protein VG758_22875 [Hyphomicrobiaceae bacterium]|jgi:hypothetical protein|nr:hypothetical protein [Hyphomicrobiaceae bacterium]
MPSGKEAAAVWRAKAEEARANAAQATERQARATFLKIAEAYDHLADIAERAAGAKPNSDD